MKKNYYSTIMPILALCACVFVSCGDDNDGIETPKECFTRPTNVLILSDGFAYNWEHGEDTRYFYDNLFTIEEYNKMSQAEISNEVVTGNVDDRTAPDASNYACYYNLKSNQEYVYVTVSYRMDGTKGEMITTHFKTKNSSSQPLAQVTECSLYNDNDGNTYYGWDVKKNTYCREYYTYAAASKDYFKTLYWASEGATAIYAWAILEEIKKNPSDHSTRINELTNGSEYFYAAQLNNGISYLPAILGYDKYLQIVTWGLDNDGELSGMLDCNLYNLEKASSSSSRVLCKSNREIVDREPKSVIVNKKDIAVFRMK